MDRTFFWNRARTAGSRTRERELLHSPAPGKELETAYREMARDEAREAEAWSGAMPPLETPPNNRPVLNEARRL